MHPTTIYKISTASDWAEAQSVFTGAPIDVTDGFIHFSTAAQVAETAKRHFHGQANLVLVAIDATVLGDALVWEPSRGGDLFPHLYGQLPTSAALWVKPMALDAEGVPQIPPLDAE